ncbi:MAG: hypothetical protein DBY16_05440 [Coprobacter sp.]|nr:MAG: hypothetical protein DBY16_05440 [Coprobacter sp.]
MIFTDKKNFAVISVHIKNSFALFNMFLTGQIRMLRYSYTKNIFYFRLKNIVFLLLVIFVNTIFVNAMND